MAASGDVRRLDDRLCRHASARHAARSGLNDGGIALVSRKRGLFAGTAVAALLAGLGAVQVIAQSGARTISLYNIHTKETVTVLFKKDGKYVDAGLAQVNHVLRDHRRNEETKMDPALIDILWEVHNELGSKEPIHIISGYRSKATNEMLRRTVGGQASESRHILGKAADVHFPDVDMKKVRYSALIREQGGVGYYPTSAIPFVHIDTDRVRAWPRLPRYELALLFPSGQTKHAAADGGPITKDDVRVAQAKYRDLAVQVAAFHDARQGGHAVAVAEASPPAIRPAAVPVPKLAEALAVATQPKPQLAALPAYDTAALSRLTERVNEPQLLAPPALAPRPKPAATMASLSGGPGPAIPSLAAAKPREPKVAAIDPADQLTDAGRFALGGNWTPAPAYDDEHPDELSYRPFPIAPLLTHTANEPIMAEMIHHDVARTVDMIDQPGLILPLTFRPGEQTAQLLWSQHFTGAAVGSAIPEPAPKATAGVRNRAVRTTQK